MKPVTEPSIEETVRLAIRVFKQQYGVNAVLRDIQRITGFASLSALNKIVKKIDKRDRYPQTGNAQDAIRVPYFGEINQGALYAVPTFEEMLKAPVQVPLDREWFDPSRDGVHYIVRLNNWNIYERALKSGDYLVLERPLLFHQEKQIMRCNEWLVFDRANNTIALKPSNELRDNDLLLGGFRMMLRSY